MFDWPYTLSSDGRLFDEEGQYCHRDAPRFKTAWEAEQWLEWLEHNDERGNVREEVSK